MLLTFQHDKATCGPFAAVLVDVVPGCYAASLFFMNQGCETDPITAPGLWKYLWFKQHRLVHSESSQDSINQSHFSSLSQNSESLTGNSISSFGCSFYWLSLSEHDTGKCLQASFKSFMTLSEKMGCFQMRMCFHQVIQLFLVEVKGIFCGCSRWKLLSTLLPSVCCNHFLTFLSFNSNVPLQCHVCSVCLI